MDRINKRGEVGIMVIMTYRILIVIVVAVVILGASVIIYSHHINVRDTEAMIMVREISDCVISDAVVNLTTLRLEDDIFEHCGYDENEVESFFVAVAVAVDKVEVFMIEGGDSGLLWVKDIYDPRAGMEVIDRYEPGHFKRAFNVVVFNEGVERDGSIVVEVVINAE